MFGRNKRRWSSADEEDQQEKNEQQQIAPGQESNRQDSSTNEDGDVRDSSGTTTEEEAAVRNKEGGSGGAFNSDFHHHPTAWQVKRATRTRMTWALISSFFLLVSLVFVILVEIGSTRVNSSILLDIYFLRLDLADIVPVNVPNSGLINSIAQSLGLHDFYTVGLWNFCYGDNGEGFQHCSKPETLYWFDPVSILRNELLAGASIALPSQLTNILDLIRTVSHWMFALFLTGACLTFVMIFIVPTAVYSRWASFPIMIFTFLAALFTTVASVLATVLFIVATDAITAQQTLNIGASVGVEMFVFMWIGSAFAILAWLVQLSLCCCCASRRDVRTGRKFGSKKAWRI